ncbi:uncharacterized protein LOC127287923 [Leptopilina boulardi]|uniref:uncharacterized protein LOC127287923 n=1 Tax=Leptopilina boulardi TaxID=63433 RepID=UPI0021F5EE97|nr:uncharacterized protein LOC127287923 [Leptopilina boulardi]
MTLSEEEIETLKRKRAPLKGKLTKFINFIDNKANKNKVTEIKMRLEGLSGILDVFESIQLQGDAATKTTGKEFDEFEKLYYETISRAVDLIQSSNPQQSAINSGNSSQITMSSQRVAFSNQVKLPQIELITFDGTYDKWLDFYNSFNSMVHDNPNLSKIQKLFYLKSCLKEEAVTTINALEISEDNYKIAWNLLTERYNNKRVIAQKHVKTLMEIPNISKESTSELRKLLDTVRSHLRSLKSLGEPVEHWDTLLIYVITAKTDRNSHREWEKSITTTDMPQMKIFLEFLEQRCQILQVTSINVTPNNQNQANGLGKSQNNTQKKQSFMTSKKPVSCLICKETHKIYECEKFKGMTVKERANVIKENRVCFNCLNSGHRNNECKWSGCKKCGQKHNTLLHYEKFNNNEKSEVSEGKSDSVQSASNSKLVVAITRSSPSQVLLSTALIDIKDKDGNTFQARVLLDNGSQSHFITQKFTNLLKLPRKNVEIPVEGLNQLETRIKQSVQAEILSKKRNYKERVEFLIIPSICDQLPNEFVGKNSLNIPQHIQLADPEFFEPKKIDALLGVEIFYD